MRLSFKGRKIGHPFGTSLNKQNAWRRENNLKAEQSFIRSDANKIAFAFPLFLLQHLHHFTFYVIN